MKKSALFLTLIDNVTCEDSYFLGERFSLKLRELNSKVFIIFADGVRVNGEKFMNGILHESPKIVMAAG